MASMMVAVAGLRYSGLVAGAVSGCRWTKSVWLLLWHCHGSRSGGSAIPVARRHPRP